MSSSKQKISILGGGIAGLTAAYELSKTNQYDITIYQMGWRLGGKLASGRNSDDHNRNEEHGLHVWFGYYENAFSILQDCYKEILKVDPRFKFKDWREAFKPNSLTPIGEYIDGKYTYLPFTWALNADTPGDGKVLLTPWGAITEVINILRIIFKKFLEEVKPELTQKNDTPHWMEDFFYKMKSKLSLENLESYIPLTIAQLLDDAHSWSEILDLDQKDDEPMRIEALRWFLEKFKAEITPHLQEAKNEGNSIDSHLLLCVADVLVATLLGLLNPEYGVTKDMDLGRIDHLEFREFLVKNGCSKEVAFGWSGIKALYDAYFYYIDGKLDKPNVAAGTAVRVLIRTVVTYKGAILYLVQAGMGEALIAPLYKVLENRGVKFEFFHKVKKLELSQNKNQIQKITISKQVNIKNEFGNYKPTHFQDGLFYWPNQPFWEQIEDGDKMKAQKINFESNWCQWPEAGELVLENGKDFDITILAISLGAFKKLNSQPSICEELIEASPAFANLVNNSALVPSMGVQLWMIPDLPQMGWDHGKPAMDGGAEPLSVWTDMSQVMDFEDWKYPDKPGSLQYLTGVMDTELHKEPTTNSKVPEEAMNLLKKVTIDWLEKYTYSIWPKATGSNPPSGLDWSKLYDSQSRIGKERLDAQYLRPNVDPTECCILSTAGTVKFRLKANESGFTNLILCGEWTRSGMNTSCVEGSIMSGMLASKAISGSPAIVVGENFMQKP